MERLEVAVEHWAFTTESLELSLQDPVAALSAASSACVLGLQLFMVWMDEAALAGREPRDAADRAVKAAGQLERLLDEATGWLGG